MTRDETLDYIHRHSEEYATQAWGRDKSGQGWICPICGSGSGDKGTGITTKDHIHFTCWGGDCFGDGQGKHSADIIDIIGRVQGISDNDMAAKFEAARREFGLDDVEPGRGTGARVKGAVAKPAVKVTGGPGEGVEKAVRESPPFTGEHEYLSRKGVGVHGNMRRYGQAILLPVTDIDGRLMGAQTIYPGQKEKPYLKGSKKIGAFYTLQEGGPEEPVLVAEGYATAAAVLENIGDGVTVIAGMDSGNLINVTRAFRVKYPYRPVIIAADDDSMKNSAGQKAARDCVKAGYADGYMLPPFNDDDRRKGRTDWDDFFLAYRAEKTRAALEGLLEPTLKNARAKLDALKAENEKPYESRSEWSYLPAFIERIRDSQRIVAYPTGFSNLDEILNGGLRPGLYILGALSSLGKTSFVLQVADNVAAWGGDVLFFSLEMSQDELIAKSLSRLSYQVTRDKRLSKQQAMTTAQILAGDVLSDGNLSSVFVESLQRHQAYTKNIYIIECHDDYKLAEIRERTEEHIKATGRKPLVIVDYMQIVGAETDGLTDKQRADRTVRGLRVISRDCDVPVLTISSLNRENYNTVISMTAFKESGGIEYSADVLLGMQYEFMNYRAGEPEGERKARIRTAQDKQEGIAKRGEPHELDLKVLKNRNGRKGSVDLDFVAKFNYYAPRGEADNSFSEIE